MDTIKVKGHGNLKVPDDFRSWSKEKQQALIKKAIANKPPPADKKKHDWISDVTGTAGSVIGGIGGALGGALTGPFAPAAIPTLGVAGSVSGGAAGGAFGEWLEGKLDPRGRRGDEVFDTAVTEGAFGLIPGVGGVATKAGVRGGGAVLGILPKLFGFPVKTPAESILKGASKFSEKQLEKFFNKNVTNNVSKTTQKKLNKFGVNNYKDLMQKMDDDTFRKKIVKGLKGDKDFEKAINKFYAEIAAKGQIAGQTAAVTGKGLLANENSKEYNQGGLVFK